MSMSVTPMLVVLLVCIVNVLFTFVDEHCYTNYSNEKSY